MNIIFIRPKFLYNTASLMFVVIFIFILAAGFNCFIYGEDIAGDINTEVKELVSQPLAQEVIAAATVTDTTRQEQVKTAGNITLDFKDADIRSVLKIISLKAGVNIVASPDVTGMVSIYLDDVPWEKALDVILKTYGFGYEKKGNIIQVAPLDKLTEQKKMEQELTQVQPTITEVFKLKYIDAIDAKKALDPLISPRGKITALETTGQSGWEFGGEALGKKEREEKEHKGKTKILLITDIPPVIDDVRALIEKIDVSPRQIIIEAKILEVSRNYLEDIGFDYATGTVGDSVTRIPANTEGDYEAGGQVRNSVTPSVFSASATGLTPSTAGMNLVIRKVLGSDFEVLLHALEEDVNSNLLSSPRVLTLDNQEATILVGTKYPILSTSVSGTDTTTTTTSLDYYQDIGVQLNVVPQISGENKVNMIIHPSVTSYTTVVGTNAYPVINTREVETQLLINDGETIVIGGLVKDNENKSNIGVPFLSKIPFLGKLFKRDTTDLEKIELLIFITARIVKDSDLTDKESAFLKENASTTNQ